MGDPLSVAASAIAVAHVIRRIYEVGNAAYRSNREKREFNHVLDNLAVQVSSLQALEGKASHNPEDPRYAGFRAILKSSKQFVPGKDVEPDPSEKAPGVVERLLSAMQRMEDNLKIKHGIRAGVRKVIWFHEKDKFQADIDEIKQWTDVVRSILSYDHFMVSIGTDDRVQRLELEAAKAAEDRALAAEERRQATIREQQRIAEKAFKLRETRRLELIKWVSPLRFRERHSALLNQHQTSIRIPDLLQTEEFELWTTGRPWILHCEGKLGAGKTTLCAIVGDHLEKLFQSQDRNIPVLYIYLSHKEQDSQSLSNLFGSLLKQLLQISGTIFQSSEAQNLYEGAESEGRPSWSAFNKAFCAEAEFYERVVVIVDALDEASPLDVAPQLHNALRKFPKDHINVMMTSQRVEDGPPPTRQNECNLCGKRPLKVFYRCHTCNDGRFHLCQECIENGLYCEDALHELAQPGEVLMSIEPSDHEIQHYVQAELEAELEVGKSEDDDNPSTMFSTTPLGRLCKDSPWLKDEISNSVVAKADGMFALAQLYLSSFKSLGLTEPEVLEMLDDPPEGYTGLYEQHMERISENSFGRVGSNLGISVLLWVACASRPLRFVELQDALAINLKKSGYFTPSARRDKATIIRATAGLVTIEPNEDGAVRLNHGTAQRYFDNNRDRWFGDASTLMTRVSLHYLSLTVLSSPGEGEWEDKEFDMRDIDYPFLRYAYQYWGDHAESLNFESEVQDEIMQFVKDENKMASAIQAMWYLRSEAEVDWDVRKGANAIHLCAWFGLNHTVSRLVDQGANVNCKDARFAQTPLMYACRRGKVSTVALLLDQGAYINAISTRGSTALFEAVSADRAEVLEMLLANPKLDVNSQHPGRSGQTALMIAAQEGKVGAVAALLKNKKLDQDQKDANGYTALSHAIRANQTQIALQILQSDNKPRDLNSLNWTGNSALMLAASKGQAEIVDTLLTQGADSTIKDKEGGGTALLRAIDAGHFAVVESMLKHDIVDLQCLDDDKRGLLHGAATSGHVDIVRLLLQKRLDVNAKDRKGRTPLHDASRKGSVAVVKLLLDTKANTLVKDEAERTPKDVAWQYGHSPTMNVLEGRDPYECMAEDLPDEYPDVEKLPIWSLANLRYTAEVTKAVVTRSQEVKSSSPDTHDTALNYAVFSDQPEMVKVLLQAKSPVNVSNDYGRTPLHFAALSGNDEIMGMLLKEFEGEEEAEIINAPDKWGTSPLLMAHSYGHVVCCLLLIEAGATIISSKSVMKQSLFFAAIENGRLAAVQRLAHMGADLQVKNVLGLTGLQMAKERGYADVENFLRKSKSVRVDGLGLSIDEREKEDEVMEEKKMIESATTPPSPMDVFKRMKHVEDVGEPISSPTPSLEERFKALELPRRRTGLRSGTEAEDESDRMSSRPAKVQQLA